MLGIAAAAVRRDRASSRIAVRVLDQPPRDQLDDGGLGPGLQVVFALIVLKTTIGQRVFATLGDGINKLLGFAGVGAAFVFGPLGDSSVWGRAMTGALGPEGAQLRA